MARGQKESRRLFALVIGARQQKQFGSCAATVKVLRRGPAIEFIAALPAVGALSLKRSIRLKRRGMIFNHESKRRLTRSGDRDHAAMLNTHLRRAGARRSNPEAAGGGGAAAIRRARFPTSGGTQRFPHRGRITFPPRRCRRSFRPIRSRSEFSAK